jgi:hypothetical protein
MAFYKPVCIAIKFLHRQSDWNCRRKRKTRCNSKTWTGPPLKNFDWGPLGGFTTAGLNVGYQVNEQCRVNLGVTTLFNISSCLKVFYFFGRYILLFNNPHLHKR